MDSLRKIREKNHITQQKASELCGISLRTYQRYENDPQRQNSLVYKAILDRLNEEFLVDEEHGILSVEQIRETCAPIFDEYDIRYCFLFGSYAKNKATPVSDVDLVYSGDVHGIKHCALAEKLRQALHKVVDLLDDRQIHKSMNLMNEVLADGIKIYG